MYNIVNSKLYKSILSKIPLLALFVITVSTNYYYFYDESYKAIYRVLSYITGFSIFSLLPYFYIVYKFKFCTYSKIAVWGIFGYICINIIYWILETFLEIKDSLLSHIFEAVFITGTLFLALYSLAKENFKNYGHGT